MLRGKSVARLVTSFSLDEPDEKISAMLRLTAALQAGLFAVISAGMIWLCRRERLVVEKRAAGDGEVVIPEETLAEWLAETDMPAWFSDGGERADALGIAGSSLEKAAQLLAGEAQQQLHAVSRARGALVKIDAWRQAALQGGGNAASLIASGREILAMIEADAGRSHEPVAALATVEAAIASVERLAHGLADQGEVSPLLTPDARLRSAARLAGEGVETIRERVFPALATAVGAGENVAARLAPLVQVVDACGDRSSELARYSGELFDLADAIRLLRRELQPDDAAGSEGAESGLNRMAQRVETLAAGLKRETLDLLGMANEAAAAARTILSTMDDSREKLLAAGSAVEDCAAAAVMGSDHLHGFLRSAGVEAAGDAPLPSAAAMPADLLEELRALLTALRQALAETDRPPHGGPAEQVQSLSLVAENLLLAGRFLTEIADGAALLAESGAGELQEQGRAGSDAAIRQLILAARASLGQVSAGCEPAEEEPAGKH